VTSLSFLPSLLQQATDGFATQDWGHLAGADPPQGSQVHYGNFPTKAQAVAWARKVEAEMDARRFNDTRGLANITLKELIDWYFEEIAAR
jgi:hypothetical protein